MDIYNDKTYLANNPDWHEKDAPFKAEKMLTLLRRNSIPLDTIGEVGCGSGEILVQLSTHLPNTRQFAGIDISGDAIGIARKKTTDRVGFELKAIEDETAFFDLLLVIDVIEHIENYFSFLRALRPRSQYTLFHIPLDMCAWSLFREGILLESKSRVGHLHNFTEAFIIDVLHDQGFTVLDKLYTEPSYEQTSPKQKIVDFSRKILFRINKKFCTKTFGGYSIMLLTKNK
jgi:predicted TPR repeat methyltransferase